MTTDWAHLPNAVHIDRVIASVKANPDQWDETWSKVQDAGRTAARQAARDVEWSKARGAAQDAGRSKAWNTAYDTAYDAAYDTAHDAARNAARFFAQYAILALVAYDDCAYMLDSDPGELAILAAFGDPRAVLLLYACKVFHSLKEIA